MLPFSYACRNLLREPGRLAQKIGGSALVIFLLIAAGAFNNGMRDLLRASGSPRNVILLGAGSEESVERSQIPVRTESMAAAGIRGIDQRGGFPAVSGEVVYMGMIHLGEDRAVQGLTRGVTPSALAVHREVRLLEGSWPASGEVIVGRLAHHVLGLPAEALGIGSTIELEGEAFRVSGQFDAMGTIMESEIWFDRNDLMTVVQRETLSCVAVRLRDPADFAYAELFTKQRLDLELTAIAEDDYYANLARFYGPIRGLTWLTAAMVALGAVLGGLNMLYASFSSRVREIGTLQTLGYRRKAVFFSLIQESLLTQLVGLLVAASGALLLLEGRMIQFSMGTFEMALSGPVMLVALLAALALGTVGTLPPALRCLRLPVPAALKSNP